MTINTQQHANLADDSYEDRQPSDRPIKIEGVEYRILEHMDRSSGYQGTIYQRVDTGEIIVAHRGTELDRELGKDAGIADGGMVAARTNAQADDAIELTRLALKWSERLAPIYGHPLEVTVTGHSLGGTLAQITAHKFHLRGETFNAYGAVSLGYGLPEGGSQIINHVKASDVVSAGSHHFGQVRMYASNEDVRIVRDLGGYDNDRNPLDIRSPGLALVGGLAKSHNMHHFTNVDGDDKQDRSILADPNAQHVAQEHRLMFDKYRNDIHTARAGVSITSGVALQATEMAGHATGQTLQAAGQTIKVTTHLGAEQARTVTHVAGAVAATSLDNAGNVAAGVRETAAAVDAKIDRLQGHVQKQGAAFGADVLRGIGSRLPDGIGKWVDSKADHLQQAGNQAHRRNEAEAAAARHAGHEDAAVIRHGSQKIQAEVAGSAARLGDFQHGVVRGAGQRVGNTLEGAGHLTEAVTRRPSPQTEQAAQKEPAQGLQHTDKSTQQKTAPATTSDHVSALSSQLERMLAAGQSGDWNVFRKETQSLANGEAGQAMRGQATATVDRHEQQAAQQLAAQQALHQEAPVMRHAR